MQIVDFVQDSYQEFDDLHSLVLFSKGCNFNCKDCYNLQAITYSQPIGTAIELLEKNITPLHEGVVFLGGEPCIWENDLVEAVKYAKFTLGLKTKVYSNASKPDIIRKLIYNKAIDAFSFDFKCVYNTIDVLGCNLSGKQYCNSVFDCIYQCLKSNISVEVRTTSFDNVDIKEIQEKMATMFPSVKHIIQKPFEYAQVEQEACMA